MERRKFLENTCPTVTFAFFGLSFIQACSKSDDDHLHIPLIQIIHQAILMEMTLNQVTDYRKWKYSNLRPY